jgi:hypothetical protein
MIFSWLLLKRPIGPENELLRLWQKFANRGSKPQAPQTEEDPGEATVKLDIDQ